MKFVIFSDIHANLTALQACYDHFIRLNRPAKVAILGDYIDYGPRPNEVIALIQKMRPYLILCGNHEKALWSDERERFSSARGALSVEQTKRILNDDSLQFIMGYKQAYKIIEEGRKRILFVHGDMSDPFWGKMSFNEMQKEKYKGFDFVVSGHTHVPHLVEIFYEDDNSEMRNKKKTTFLNHGSVGQPRNHCKEAQYAIFDANTEMFTFYKVPYNISLEQSFFTGKMDVFYRERLNSGI